jgi:hypothetical protein
MDTISLIYFRDEMDCLSYLGGCEKTIDHPMLGIIRHALISCRRVPSPSLAVDDSAAAIAHRATE